MEVFLGEVPYKKTGRARNDYVLFSESNSRFCVEVSQKDQKAFEKELKGVPLGLIGCLRKENDFIVHGLDGKACVKEHINNLKEAWQKPLRW